MINATVIGNIGRDAETRAVGSDTVCSFSVASSDGFGDKKTTTWVRCSLWGKRGDKLAPMLAKGTRVAVCGTLSEREHDGKKYLECRVNDVEFTAPKAAGGAAPSGQRAPDHVRGGPVDDGGFGGDDPF